jgi:hypothetical protein
MFCLKALALNLPPTTRTSFAVSAIAKLSPKRGESPTITFMGTLGIIRCSFMASSAGAVTDWVVSLPCVMYSIARQHKSFTNETSTSRAGKALLTPLPSVGNSVKIAVPPLLLRYRYGSQDCSTQHLCPSVARAKGVPGDIPGIQFVTSL